MVPPLVRKDLRQAVEESQPQRIFGRDPAPADNHLRLLKDLGNADKHHTLVLVVCSVAVDQIWWSSNTGNPRAEVRLSAHPLHDGEDVAWFDFGQSEPPAYFSPNLQLQVSLGGAHGQHRLSPTVALLDSMRWFVEDDIVRRRFGHFFGEPAKERHACGHPPGRRGYRRITGVGAAKRSTRSRRMIRAAGAVVSVCLVTTILFWSQPAHAGGASGQVVGGDPVAPTFIPYQVALTEHPRAAGGTPLLNQFCGGTLITSDMVVTAAHCAESMVDMDDPSQLYGVVAGRVDLSEATEADVVGIERAVVSPSWFTTFEDDVAILKLEDEVAGVDTVALPTPTDAALWEGGTPATVSGWGDMSADSEPRYPTMLQVGTVEVVDDETCAAIYEVNARTVIDVQRVLCAAGTGVGPCSGDSGGPLVAEGGDGPILIGVVSQGIGCASDLYPGLYARTEPHAQAMRVMADLPYSDVSFGHRFLWEISWLAGAEVTTGYVDGTFRPAAPVSRAAMAAYLYRFAGSPAAPGPGPQPFSDVGAGHPFAAEISWLASEGIASGYVDGTFRPAAPVSRAAMAAYLYRFAGSPGEVAAPYFQDVRSTHPFAGEIGWAASIGLVQGSYLPSGDLVYRPAAATSRQAMASFLYRFQDLGLQA
jgi:hypothetical protein